MLSVVVGGGTRPVGLIGFIFFCGMKLIMNKRMLRDKVIAKGHP